MKPRISIICALDEKRGIGKNNALMWHIPGELPRFKKLTVPHPIIMGRKTFDSIGRVLPHRPNIIITRDQNYKIEGAIVVHSLQDALKEACKLDQEEVFIIGGGQIFTESMSVVDRLYLTVVKGDFKADTFFPEYSEFTKVVSSQTEESGGYTYTFLELER